MSVENRTQRTSLLRGPVTDIPGLTTYIVGFGYATEAFASNASNLTSGQVSDNRLSSNVPLKNAASNAFTGPIDASSFRQVGNTTQALIPSGSVWYIDGAGGFLYRDTSDSYVTKFRVDNFGNVIVSGTLTIGTGVSIRRNATGPTAETRTAGGLKVCNADGSAVAGVECSKVVVTGTPAGGSSISDIEMAGRGVVLRAFGTGYGVQPLYCLAQGGVACVNSSAAFILGAGSTTRISEASSGVLQIGTTSNNALGSLNLANLTASCYLNSASLDVGTIYNDATVALSVASNRTWLFNMYNAGGTHRSSLSSAGHMAIGGATATSNQMLRVSPNGTTVKGVVVQGLASQAANYYEAQNSAGTVEFSVAPGGNLTASGVAKFTGYPTGLLPAAASNAGSITYDTTLAKHVGCNGSSWNALW